MIRGGFQEDWAIADFGEHVDESERLRSGVPDEVIELVMGEYLLEDRQLQLGRSDEDNVFICATLSGPLTYKTASHLRFGGRYFFIIVASLRKTKLLAIVVSYDSISILANDSKTSGNSSLAQTVLHQVQPPSHCSLAHGS